MTSDDAMITWRSWSTSACNFDDYDYGPIRMVPAQVPRGSRMTILFKALDPQMLPGHKTNGAPRKSNMAPFPLLKLRGMAERKGRLVQPKGLHWGGQSLKLSSQQREAISISLMGKWIPKKRWRRHPPCGKINNPFGSLWVWGGGLLLGFDCSTLWSRFQMLIFLIQNAKQ